MKVLVVDDSIFIRKILTDMINSDPMLQVVGDASNGREALEKIGTLKPDVVTLDIQMPVMDGLTTLKQIMDNSPLPVIMVSSLTKEGAEETFEALDLGAFDYIPKPAGKPALNVNEIKQSLLSKIKSAANARIIGKQQATLRMDFRNITFLDRVIAIGASTGGPPAIEKVLCQLPRNIPPVLIVQHMPDSFTSIFAQRLDKICGLSVKEAEAGDYLEDGRVYIAKGGYHMELNALSKIKLVKGPPQNGFRPAVDSLMKSVAWVVKDRAVGVILTGMGRDGAAGIKAIKRRGGSTIAQDDETSVVYGMPKAAKETGAVDSVAPIQRVGAEIVEACRAP